MAVCPGGARSAVAR